MAASTLLGGRFDKGFMYAAIAATAYWGYTEMMKYPPDPMPGKNDLPRGWYDPEVNGGRPPIGSNVVFFNDAEGDFLSQQELASNVANTIPGVNATAQLHDYWVNNMVNPGFVAYGITIPPALIVTYGSLLSGPLSPVLIDQAVDDSN